MPRKLIPPSEPLPANLQERLEVFKKYTVEHAMLIRKDDALTQRIWEPGGFAFVLLTGPTGVGKSELLRVVTHRMQTRAQVVMRPILKFGAARQTLLFWEILFSGSPY